MVNLGIKVALIIVKDKKMKKMKTLKTSIAGFVLIVGCVLSAFANEDHSSPQKGNQKIVIKHPVGHFLEEGPAPFGIASVAYYQAKIEKSQGLQVLEKPIVAWLLLRVMPRQMPVMFGHKTLLLGTMIVILPGFFLRTLRKKNV